MGCSGVSICRPAALWFDWMRALPRLDGRCRHSSPCDTAVKLVTPPGSLHDAEHNATHMGQDGFRSKLTVEAALRARPVYPWQLTDLCSAANGRRVPCVTSIADPNGAAQLY